MSLQDYVENVYLSYVLSGEFDEAAAARWMAESELKQSFRDAMREAFYQWDFEVGTRYDSIADDLLESMKEASLIKEEGDEFIGVYYRFEVRPKDTFIRDRLSKNPVTSRISTLGSDILKRALATIAEREGWVALVEDPAEPTLKQDSVSDVPDDVIPASDRVVSRADNSAEISQIETEIDDLRRTVRESNELGSELGEEKELIELELEIAQEVISRPKFRLASLLGWLVPALKFLGDKFAGGAIAEAAKKLFALLMGL
jgi:hypothetical protein